MVNCRMTLNTVRLITNRELTAPVEAKIPLLGALIRRGTRRTRIRFLRGFGGFRSRTKLTELYWIDTGFLMLLL
jgi:hypothetical protein